MKPQVNPASSSQHYRTAAAENRARAETAENKDVALAFKKVAAAYDHLAAEMERYEESEANSRSALPKLS
jgi:hypothetical protein